MSALHVQIRGRGRDLVLLHGWAANLGVWKDFTRALSHRFRIISLDLPGHGRSDWDPSAATPAAQTWRVHETLAPITGLVATKQNRAGNFNFGQSMPDIREGDTLQPGMPVADILDLSEVEVWAKVGDFASVKASAPGFIEPSACSKICFTSAAFTFPKTEMTPFFATT